LPPGGVIEHLMVTGGEQRAAAGDERVIYSNTFGRMAVSFGANRLISDDIITTAAHGCELSRFSFEVTGRVDPDNPVGGPYSVMWTLYNTCPYAVSAGAARDARVIASGIVNIPDNARRIVEVVPAAAITLPTHLWFGLTFSRDNAGAVVGAPAGVGHSADVFDFPGSACIASLGGYPALPHASFNVELWGSGCEETNLQFSARRESEPPFQSAGLWITDDIRLLSGPCLMRGYMVGVRGPGIYDFELREACDGPAISGTQVTQVVSQVGGQEPRIFEYTFDPPIPVPQEFSYAVRFSNAGAGPMRASSPSIGGTDDFLEIETSSGACQIVDGPTPFGDALNFAVICDGPAPQGACCDRVMTFCVGGLNDGEPCATAAECGRRASCEPICRETPEINCPFANGSPPEPPQTWVIPQWTSGASCSANPQCLPTISE
jgi:hypothetical protein